jgi:hypothetical protein
MAKKIENCGTLYVHCHECNELIVKCHHYKVAYAAEKAHREQCPNSQITVGKKKYFDEWYPDIVLESNKVLIIINNGAAQIEYKPDNIEIEIRDYDIEVSEDIPDCKKDEDGDWYQEMIFPAT